MRGHGTTPASGLAATTAKKAPLYQCPMHPAITSDHPGDCPICGMKLVLVSPASTNDSGGRKARRAHDRSLPLAHGSEADLAVPRKDDMGMDYVPVYEDELAGGAPVQGLATVNIDPAGSNSSGCARPPSPRDHRRDLAHARSHSNRPTQVRKTNVKVEGFVEKIYVDFVGQSVRKANRSSRSIARACWPRRTSTCLHCKPARSLPRVQRCLKMARNLMASARRRLELWDVPAAEIDRLARTRQPTKTLTLVSPSPVWSRPRTSCRGAGEPRRGALRDYRSARDMGMADAYETDLSRIHVGMKASLTLPAYPDRTFSGRVASSIHCSTRRLAPPRCTCTS